MKVQIYGDSLMKGVLVDENFKYKPVAGKLLQELTAITGVETVNRAHFGYTVDKGQAILKKDLQKGLDCEIAVIEFGGNDCDFDWSEVAQAPESVHHPHTPIGQFLDAVTQMAKSLKDAGGQAGADVPAASGRPAVSQLYRSAGKQHHQHSPLAGRRQPDLPVSGDVLQPDQPPGGQAQSAADRRSQAGSWTGGTCGQLIARDGIHLTEAGYRLLLDEARLTLAGMSAY